MTEVAFLVSSRQGLWIVTGDLDTNSYQVAKRLGQGDFFGISWSANKVFVVRRKPDVLLTLGNNGILAPLPAFDHATMRDCHQIAVDNEGSVLWAANAEKNEITGYSFDGKAVKFWSPDPSWHPAPSPEEELRCPPHLHPQYRHWNSVFLSKKSPKIFVVAHNRSESKLREGGYQFLEPSRIYEADYPSLAVKKALARGVGVHNVCDAIGGRLLFCDSYAGCLMHGQQRVLSTPYHVRGLSVLPGKKWAVVGWSAYRSRDKRLYCNSGLYAAEIGKENILLEARNLDIGAIHDVRLISNVDLAHCPTKFPFNWRSWL